MDYDFTGNFAAAPLGPFTEANKRLVWPGLSYDADKGGAFYSIVDDSRFSNGRACRMLYKKGDVGMGSKFYQIRLKSPQTVANLEWTWLFEDNFSFYNPNPPQDVGLGKMGPCIQWGEVGGDNAKRGTRCMWWYNAQGSNHANPVFQPSCQDQATGNQLIQPSNKYSKPFKTETLYKFRIQMKGGPGGFAKYWITYPGETTETLIADTGTKDMKATATDDVLIDFAFFSGGSGPAYEPEWDSYARHGGVRYWSGEAEAGNGDTGSGEGGGTTPPTPPAGQTSRYSVAVGEVKIFRAHFLDTAFSPPKDVPAGANVVWSLTPNLVSWGAEAGPNWSAIQVKGKTAGGPCVLIATDPSTGLSTEPVNVDVTEKPRAPGPNTGICTVEPLSGRSGGDKDFGEKPPQ
jgi:hypothetical protein